LHTGVNFGKSSTGRVWLVFLTRTYLDTLETRVLQVHDDDDGDDDEDVDDDGLV